MNERSAKATRNFLLDLLASHISLARAFASVSRSAYKRGDVDQSEFARQKAIQFYSEALRSLHELPEPDREARSLDLRNLSTTINWLSIQQLSSPASRPAKEEAPPIEDLREVPERG